MKLATVIDEYDGEDGSVRVELSEQVGIVHPDLTIGADVSSTKAASGASMPSVSQPMNCVKIILNFTSAFTTA